MSEPEWKTELRSELETGLDGWIFESRAAAYLAFETVMPHIEAAYQRGLQAGRSQGRYTTGRKKWRKEDDPCTADAEGLTPASTAADEPPQGSAP